jgi:hypothetical protein
MSKNIIGLSLLQWNLYSCISLTSHSLKIFQFFGLTADFYPRRKTIYVRKYTETGFKLMFKCLEGRDK